MYVKNYKTRTYTTNYIIYWKGRYYSGLTMIHIKKMNTVGNGNVPLPSFPSKA